jgi:hypothetical protein
MDWMPGRDWGFKEQVENGNVVAPRNLRLSAAEVRERARVAEERRVGLTAAAVQAHQGYWDQQKPGGRFEHWRFAQGVSFRLGFRSQLTLTVASRLAGRERFLLC